MADISERCHILPNGNAQIELTPVELEVTDAALAVVQKLSLLSDDAVGGFIALRDAAKAIMAVTVEDARNLDV